jgi:hypothetical protein
MRHKIRLMSLGAVLIVVFIFSFMACKTTTTVTTRAAVTTTAAETTAVAVVSDYNIGDAGPAGGLIFYINPNYENDGWKYLETAPSDLPGNNNDYYIDWDNGQEVTIDTEIAIGTGKANTERIVNVQGEGNYAAKLCDDLTINGYGDWFLPSEDELNLMYENLHLKGLGSFEHDVYWSSSDYGTLVAWGQRFDYAVQFYYDKDGSLLRVRAVRAF